MILFLSCKGKSLSDIVIFPKSDIVIVFIDCLSSMQDAKKQIIVVYDGDCFLCRQFKQYLVLKQRYDLHIYDGRQHPEIVVELEKKGVNCSAGMVIGIDDTFYVWVDAIAQIDRLVASELRYDRLMIWFSRQPVLLKIVYPLVKWVRFLQLVVQGKSVEYQKDSHKLHGHKHR